MTDQTTPMKVDKKDVQARLARTLMSRGFEMFTVLEACGLNARAVCVDALYSTFPSMGPEVAMELLTNPKGVRRDFETDPLLTLFLLVSAQEYQEYATVESVTKVMDDVTTLVDQEFRPQENSQEG